MGQPQRCRRKAQEQLCCSQHGAAWAGREHCRTRAGPGQVKLGPKQVSVPLGCQDLHPPHANTAQVPLRKPSLHSIRGRAEPAPTTACPRDNSTSTDGSYTWKDSIPQDTETPRRHLVLFAFYNSESLSAHLL